MFSAGHATQDGLRGIAHGERVPTPFKDIRALTGRVRVSSPSLERSHQAASDVEGGPPRPQPRPEPAWPVPCPSPCALLTCLLSVWQRDKRDTSNFDKEFTRQPVELTPTDKLFTMNLDQNEFAGFSYTNPEFVIHV